MGRKDGAVAISQADFERLLRTKKKVKVSAVQLDLEYAELREGSAAVLLRSTFEDGLYRMYLGGAIKAIDSPEEEVTGLELCAFVLGKRDSSRVFLQNEEYKTKSQVVEEVFRLCEADTGPVVVREETFPPPVEPEPVKTGWDAAMELAEKYEEQEMPEVEAPEVSGSDHGGAAEEPDATDLTLDAMAQATCPVCRGPNGQHKFSCPNRPDGQLKLSMKRRPQKRQKYAKPECISSESPIGRFVTQWWSEYNGQPVPPTTLRPMAEQYEITWPENQWIPPGLRNEFVELTDTHIVGAEVAPDNEEGWLLLASQHFDDHGYLVE